MLANWTRRVNQFLDSLAQKLNDYAAEPPPTQEQKPRRSDSARPGFSVSPFSRRQIKRAIWRGMGNTKTPSGH